MANVGCHLNEQDWTALHTGKMLENKSLQALCVLIQDYFSIDLHPWR